MLTLAGQAKALELDQEYLQYLSALPQEDVQLTTSLWEITRRAAADLTDTEVSVATYRQRLEDISAEIQKGLSATSSRMDILNAVTHALFEKQNFQVDRSRLFEGSLDALLLSDVIDKGRGQCLSLSLLYLILAEKLDLPLDGVVVPGHFFVRLNLDKGNINIEATDRGQIRDETYYRRRFLRNFSDPVSLRRLNKKEILAVYLSNLATHYKLRGAEEHAIRIFETVDRILPRWPSLYVNIGNAHERLGRVAKAGSYYQRALDINPALCEAHYNLGLIYFMYFPRPQAARRHGEIARQLGCRMHPKFREFLKK